MPLIRGIRNWLSRRMSDSTMYGTAAADGGASLSSASWLWLLAFIVLLPVVAVLLLIGLIYEIVIRVAGTRLPGWLDWLLAGVAGLAILAGLGWWAFSRI